MELKENPHASQRGGKSPKKRDLIGLPSLQRNSSGSQIKTGTWKRPKGRTPFIQARCPGTPRFPNKIVRRQEKFLRRRSFGEKKMQDHPAREKSGFVKNRKKLGRIHDDDTPWLPGTPDAEPWFGSARMDRLGGRNRDKGTTRKCSEEGVEKERGKLTSVMSPDPREKATTVICKA